MWIADAKQMREIDRVAMAEFGLGEDDLMDQVGAGVANFITQTFPESLSVAVVCGKGNNGGDGLAAARMLAMQGHTVQVIVAAREADVRCKGQLARFRETGLKPIFANSNGFASALDDLSRSDLIVDALLGIGARGAARGAVAQAISALNRSGRPVLSVDVPSGVAADNGEELGEAVLAEITATIGLPKPCFFQGAGLDLAGTWSVLPVDYPAELLEQPTGRWLVTDEFVFDLLPERDRDSHKGTSGHVLIVAGSRQMRGAAMLAVEGALRAGAGLVTLAGVEEVVDGLAGHLPEALTLVLPGKDGHVLPQASQALLERQENWKAAVFGPGLGQDADVRAFLHQTWAEWTVPSVLDADALNAAAAGVPMPRLAPCVLTPHPGELARLLRTSVAEIQADRFGSVRQAVQQFEQAILLKGAKTLTAGDEPIIFVNDTGNPGMATGGMGDVLAGVIGGYMAQGVDPLMAAIVGAHVHGQAGDLCAREVGPIGYKASEVARQIPKVRAKLASCDS